MLSELRADAVLDHHSPGLVDRVLERDRRRGRERSSSSTSDRRRGSARSSFARPGGTIVSAGATSGDDARMNVTYMFAKQVRILGSRLGTMDDAIDAARHLSAGRFRPLVGPVLPLDQVPEAHRLMDEGRVIGKVIVTP